MHIRHGGAGEDEGVLRLIERDVGALAIDENLILRAEGILSLDLAKLYLGGAIAGNLGEGDLSLKGGILRRRDLIRLGKLIFALGEILNLQIDRILAALRGLLTGRGHRLLQALSQRAGREQRENHGQAQQHAEQSTKHTFVFHFFPPTIKYIS